jgi:cytochrome P450
MASLSLATASTPQGKLTLAHLRAMRADMIGYLEHLAAQGDFLRIPAGWRTAYFVNHPDLVGEVMTTQARKFRKPATIKCVARHLFGHNLFTSDDALWHKLRTTMAPAFHSRRVDTYADIMVHYTHEMLDAWQDGTTLDLPAAMMHTTLAITSKALFNADMRNPEVEQAIIRFIELFNQSITGVPVPGWIPTRRNREMKHLVALGRHHLQPLIDARRRTGVDQGDVLSILVRAQREDDTGLLTDAQVTNEITNLFAAGYEVTAHTLAFTLYLIAMHPEVEARLLAEIDAVLEKRSVQVADLPRLPYLERVLQESMRLLPVTTVIARQAAERVVLEGVTLRKWDMVMVSPWTLHRHPQCYDTPQHFDPGRFSPERRRRMSKFAYIPFGIGPRVCLGSAFAMLQMRLNLATILQRFRLSLVPGYILEPFYRFNTRPKGGLPMVVHQRRSS